MESFHLLGIGPVTLDNTKYGQVTAKGDAYCVTDGNRVRTRIDCNIQTSKKGNMSETLWFEEWIGLKASQEIFMEKLNKMMPKGKTLISV